MITQNIIMSLYSIAVKTLPANNNNNNWHFTKTSSRYLAVSGEEYNLLCNLFCNVQCFSMLMISRPKEKKPPNYVSFSTS